MKPTRRIKVKNGIEYWYEETPYYDKEKKQIRHRSKYLGRNVDGQPVRMRCAPAEVKEKTKKKEPAAVKSSFDYGSIFVLQSIMGELNLDSHLKDLLPPSEVSMVRALAFNRIIRPTAMMNDECRVMVRRNFSCSRISASQSLQPACERTSLPIR